MFQFTTTNVINSDKDLTTGADLWTLNADKTVFSVKRVANFKKENIAAVYKAAGQDAEPAKVTIGFGTGINASTGDTLRLQIYVGLTQASLDSRYSNDLIYKGKPFSVDFVWMDTAENTVAKLAKTIKKYSVLVYGEPLLKVSHSGKFLTLEAVDEYQRFKSLSIDKYTKNTNEYPYSGTYETLKDLSQITVQTDKKTLTGTVEGLYEGQEGFGTYSYLLHNLRLPTTMRTRAFGVNQDETPVVGALYDQYTIHYCVNRGILGTNAVGDVVKSMTTHVFFVKSDLSEAFGEKLGELATPIEVTNKSTTNPSDPYTAAAVSAATEAVNKAIDKLKADNSLT